MRFKTHSSRYACLEKRKMAKKIKIAPNLTHRRGKMLFDASKIIEEKDVKSINFVFANLHGDLQVRLTEPLEGKHVHPFKDLQELDDLLLNNGLIPQSYFA